MFSQHRYYSTMRSSMKTRQLLIAIFVLGLILLNQPIISILYNKGVILGIPVMLFYMFSIWALLIVLMALVTLSSKSKIKRN